jgi:Uma2 family endonuclease
MAMVTTLPRFTVDDLESFPDDGNRYELLNGVVLVTPQAGLPHQTVASALGAVLWEFLRPAPEIRIWSPGVIQIQPATHLEPDILVGRMPEVAAWEAVREHWLAVEVSGLVSRIYDRRYKRDAYLQVGVQEVWLLDLESRGILVSRPQGAKDEPHEDSVTWRSPDGRVLVVDIPALFQGLPQ